MNSRLRNVLLIALGAAGLAACNEGYGYGGMEVGYGARAYGPGYCDPYWEDCYGAYGYGYGGYGDPWWGWWGDYYYPGIGFYVYDRGGHRYRWNDNQRHYWEGRRGGYGNRNWNDQRWQNWNGFRQGNNGGHSWSGGSHPSGGSHASGGHRGH
ncbi:MAG TPA: hypothetical protein VH331_00385 [Allosphingosinicella sp.]|nr:hypothetical protein [Allosphingosinicella sp.]